MPGIIQRLILRYFKIFFPLVRFKITLTFLSKDRVGLTTAITIRPIEKEKQRLTSHEIDPAGSKHNQARTRA